MVSSTPEAAVAAIRSPLQIDENRNLAVCKRHLSEAARRFKTAQAEAHAVRVRQVESDIMSKTLGLALSKAETAETKQRAKVDALAAYERQRLLAELDVCTRLFLDDDAAVQAAVPPPPVPPPVPLSPAKVLLPAQAPATPVHAGPDSASVPPTLAPTPAPTSPAKVLIAAQDP